MASATLNKIAQVFPKALPNQEMVKRVSEKLGSVAGYTKANTLLATSLCCDELARPLEQAFGKSYGDQNKHFSMGGLAGFPFGGLTSFGAMAAHIPDDGHCLLVYGPHVGVDSTGEVGTVERVGRLHGGACCGSACAACNYVLELRKNGGEVVSSSNPQDPIDAQQTMVGNLLMPHAQRLADASEIMVELPYALLDAQRDMMESIVTQGAPNVADPGMIAVVGGIQINTPPEISDYFMPSHFDLYNNQGVKVDELMWDEH